ncbi:MAG: ribonuclease HII [Proteobacteria bacterium]|nr:ribonuclease HII [Pseudomonadota bacterium]
MKPTFETEALFLPKFVIGVDEVGYGAWAGPVIVGAVALDISALPSDLLNKINDSKSLSFKKRENVYESFMSYSGKGIYFSLDHATNQEVDALNVRGATQRAMKRAVEKLLNQYPAFLWGGILVDGTHAPNFSLKTQCIVGGDRKCLSIAAASIVAKVTRDRMMQRLSEEYPHYAWDKNVGYGTKHHQEGLKSFGPSPHHRMSYKPLQAFM